MKSKGVGWPFAPAMLVIAGVLFLPVPTTSAELSPIDQLRSLSLQPILAWLVAAAGFWAFKLRFWPGDASERRKFSSSLLLLIVQAVLLRTVSEIAAVVTPSWYWLPQDYWIWVPWFLVPGLTAILLGGRFGVLLCLTGALMVYLLADPGPWPLVSCMVSALLGILLLRRSPTRARVIRAGTGTGALLGVAVGSHYAFHGSSIPFIGVAILVALFLGVLSAFLVLALLPILEWMLGELSDVTVIEYSTDHPLLDRLRTEAPGTWYHSLNVADLAEKAAAEVGARALFCRTAALYHDIGKLKEPTLFAENNDGPSPHDKLEPQVSAQRIIEHVSYGLELSKRHRLPKPFRDIIAEHHGVSTVRFFYAKACEPRPDGSRPKVDRASFCYPGPQASTRESGIVALADVIEAATRSLSPTSEADLRLFVRQLLAERVSEGELSECPLTLSDLAKIQGAFVRCLKGRHHHRPSYPQPTGMPLQWLPRDGGAMVDSR